MEVIKRVEPPPQKTVEWTCGGCTSVIRAKENECKDLGGGFITNCPVCGRLAVFARRDFK